VSDLPPKAGAVQEFVQMLNSTLATKGSFPNMTEVQHPLAKIFQPIPEDELGQLAKDIEQDGLIQAMVLYQQKVLDGNTRFEALKRFRGEFRESDFRCLEDIVIDPDDKAAERYVISANALRRHLSKKERDVLGAKYFLAMPKEKPGPKPEQTKTIAQADNSTQKLRGIPGGAEAQDVPAQKRPYDRRLEEAAAKSGGTPGGIRAQLPALEKKGPEATAGRAIDQKPPRAPRKPKEFKVLKDGLTLRQIFQMMIDDCYQKLEGTVAGFGRVIFIADAEIKINPGTRATESEVIEYCESRGLPKSDGEWLFAKWEANRWTNNNTPIKDWRRTIVQWQLQGDIFPSHKRAPLPPRAPQGRSTMKTPAEADRAAVAQDRTMRASLERQEKLDEEWKRR
jgi:hypothetical protein